MTKEVPSRGHLVAANAPGTGRMEVGMSKEQRQGLGHSEMEVGSEWETVAGW